ncbi:MAG: hypothetical protein Roseis2KO_60190 [Roseivirga sp.]
MVHKTQLALTLLLSISLIFFTSGCQSEKGPFKNGLYESTQKSEKQGFLLEIDGPQATLYGWNLSFEKDTSYYKASARFENDRYLSFKDYTLSNQPYDLINLEGFETKQVNDLWQFTCYTSFHDITQTDNIINLNAVMLVDNSASDHFEFKLIE